MNHESDYFRSICKVSQAFGTTRDRDELLNLIVESAVETMKVKAALLILIDEDEKAFIPVAWKGISERYLKEGLTEPAKIVKLLEENGYIYEEDATRGGKLENLEIKKEEGIVSVLSFPMKVKGKFLGAVILYTDSPRVFNQDEMDFVKALGEQAAMAIDHARLIKRLRENTSLLLDLAANIQSSLDLKKILHIMTADVADYFKVKASSILLVDENRKTLEIVASSGLSEAYLDRGPLTLDKSVEQSLAGQPVAIRDVSTDEKVQHKKEKEKEGIVSILSIPMKAGDKVIGVLRLYSGVPREFTKGEILMGSALAQLGALAIQNASLYLMLESDVKDLRENTWSYRSWF